MLKLTNCGRIIAVNPSDVQETADSEAPDIMFICSMVDYGIHTYIEAVRYISSPKSVFVYLWYKLQNCVVKLKLRTIFLCFFLVCSRK